MTGTRDARRERQKRKNDKERDNLEREKEVKPVLAIAAQACGPRFEKNVENACPRSLAATRHDKRDREEERSGREGCQIEQSVGQVK